MNFTVQGCQLYGETETIHSGSDLSEVAAVAESTWQKGEMVWVRVIGDNDRFYWHNGKSFPEGISSDDLYNLLHNHSQKSV